MFPRVPLANKWQKAPSSGRSDKKSISPFFNEEDDDKSPSLVNPRVCCLNGFVRSNKSRLHVVLSSESKGLLKDEPLLKEKGGGGHLFGQETEVVHSLLEESQALALLKP